MKAPGLLNCPWFKGLASGFELFHVIIYVNNIYMRLINYWALLCENQEDRPNFFLDDSNIFPFDEVYEDISNNNLEKFV